MENALAPRIAPSARPAPANALAGLYFDPRYSDVASNPTPQFDPTIEGARDYAMDPRGRGHRIVMGFAANPATFQATGPLDLYHGTRAANVATLRPSERGPFGPAVYMSPARSTAQQYAGESGSMYSAPVPPDAFYGLGRSWITNGSQVNPYQVWRDQVARLVDAAPPATQAQIAEIGARMDPSDGYPFFRRLSILLGGDEAAQALFQRAGFSGVSGMVDGPEVAIFRPVPVRPAQ